ncbi:Gastric triacylglycerol lipase [Trichostrongylus colubriformis]|uniref:Lipase n=1 Tax=Trichostrongylus colubriformis TaxID=6319 RepID=A0AAN8EQ80_TRICO
MFVIFLAAVVASSSSLNIDPECYMTVPEIVRYYGYPSEVHIVRTHDDYILELHRVPHGRHDVMTTDRPVIFLQHGVFSDGFAWAANLANESAAFVFADAGFDVWMANSRGTPSSQKHIGYGPDEPRFWNFTWQDMCTYDLTASINYVLNQTKQESLYFVGHSQGTVLMFATLAGDPHYAKKIRQFHALAPVATVSHIGGLFKIFGYRLIDVAKFLLARIPNTPLVFPKFIQKIMSYFCSLPIAQGVCTLDIGFIDGTEKMFNTTRVGTYLCHMPAATSSKNILHWIQVVKSRKLEKFDYGEAGNMREYGTKDPPHYDLRKIRTPTYLYWSRDDILADTEDIREAILEKMNATIRGSYELPHYSHLDFVYGINATQDIYQSIILDIRKDLDSRRLLVDNRIPV